MLRAVVPLVAFLAAAAGAATVGVNSSPAGRPADLQFGQELANYPAHKVVTRHLPDGGRLAVGSRTGHDVSVQWLDSSTHTWTKPQTIETEPKLWTHDISVKRLGPTVAVAPDWWVEKVLDDDYAPSFTSLSVCRDYRCDGPRTSKQLSSAVLAEGGDLVSFGLDDHTVLLWESGSGYRRSTISGIPLKSGSNNIRLLSDGKFIGVAGRWDGKKCHYDLYTAGHRSTTFTRAVKSPGFYDAKPCYLASTEVSGDNQVKVWVEMLSDDISFRRHGSRWSLNRDALSRMQIKDTHGRSTLAPLETGAGRRRVVFGSHDMRRILYQWRDARRSAWSTPKIIAHAPKGTLCRTGTTNGTFDDRRPAIMVLIQCYATGHKRTRTDMPGDTALVFATSDGRHWAKGRVRHPGWEALMGKDKVIAIGDQSLAYSRGARTFTLVRLPLKSRWDGYTLMPGGNRVLRIVGNGNANGLCAPAYAFAKLTDTAWPTPTPIVAPEFPRRGTCTGSANADAEDIVTVGVYQPDLQWENSMRLKNGKLTIIPIE